jgi:hypothetical protein
MITDWKEVREDSDTIESIIDASRPVLYLDRKVDRNVISISALRLVLLRSSPPLPSLKIGIASAA